VGSGISVIPIPTSIIPNKGFCLFTTKTGLLCCRQVASNGYCFQHKISIFTAGLNTILISDCIVGLKKLPNESASIIICDPPYNIGKNFGNNSDKQRTEKYLGWCKL